MLSPKVTATVLYIKPSLNHLTTTYQRKLNYVTSLEYNSRGICAEVIFDIVGDIIKKIEALKMLNNVIDTAYSMLNSDQQKIIKTIFYKKIPIKESKQLLSKNRYEYDVMIKNVFNKMRTYIYLLGFTDEMIIKHFDSEPLFLEMASKVNRRFNKEQCDGNKCD